ncbi:hypothetical protein OO014_08430 [Intrasporangium calvum]|uniref:Uncharacterized protein n=1 Tax=Intrasporangium calvum TaxID=53358 RepID=A0ABT5GGD3_9MICO|nr:hypothetical protein [Intrasporangium calvum]MDC5697282.1 hypothetical protein [Intrasporangium calvum]
MRAITAQLPDRGDGDDRVHLTANAVIVLDGASAFLNHGVSAATYVDSLGASLTQLVRASPDADLTEILRDAIARTRDALDLIPGRAPSSTVAIARATAEAVDLLVLGDSQVATPKGTVRDDRLAHVAPDQRKAYRTWLAEGHGYDDTLRGLLHELQAEQIRYRNRPGGYWIAEADPNAAQHAITSQLTIAAVPWLVVATDGAYKPMGYLGLDNWATLAHATPNQLSAVLMQCQQWEAQEDPDGAALPRAKRHDDKTIAACQLAPRT